VRDGGDNGNPNMTSVVDGKPSLRGALLTVELAVSSVVFEMLNALSLSSRSIEKIVIVVPDPDTTIPK